MAKGTVSQLLNFIVWLTGILVSLAVGFGMAQGTLTIPWLDAINASLLTVIAGLIVVLLTIVGAILAIVNK
jgi:hypothetical protein